MVVNNKQAALKIIEQMPDDVSLEDIMYELLLPTARGSWPERV
jgi:hypothetical protein